LGIILANAELLEAKCVDEGSRARASQVVTSVIEAMSTARELRVRVDDQRETTARGSNVAAAADTRHPCQRTDAFRARRQILDAARARRCRAAARRFTVLQSPSTYSSTGFR